ncbi:bifunctional 5,10-methylenetetrahydrofolate dehydrogenase/5,10-methenyltetrahydrofolate cyclohydrolase [Bacillus sp. FJAT-50079]|uniref:bifunctional 5,10-methylenetetrahydrofolate dehydrogenase/5,10-methenyltetrahydrofolate cyclohydrolase n=1 Tax=Bacillus sp. FJAT-50079 TaxID=2833577 RepID=UPI001BCA3F2E|nr:bifunctional 5,10-methylenetetrahydrofolate dehydrogenase/5,10-methenyltetrahydrofolate cyclohydrolase [Bacillus sp. FJAT-50079]MBS4209997.1 bifunctional 5,10-methylenetetrahydrofolate dehydrogenase/5,10-methenyltetrahydrofolate cyclohydrolase [Bacillus sp. FJAT-50079]
MTKILRAKIIADQLYDQLRNRVKKMKLHGIQPRLSTILVEGDPASFHYAKAKQKIAKKLDILYDLHTFSVGVGEEELFKLISNLNNDSQVHGIMLELPLPRHLASLTIEKNIIAKKDIDGVSPTNQLAAFTGKTGLYPATPQACIRLLKYYGYNLQGKNVLLIGRGQTVGLPLFHMLLRENATVTVCHSYTPNLKEHIHYADIVFVAVGRPHLIKRDMIHSNLIIIDAGINEDAEGKMVGDVSSDVDNQVLAMSPVPGGVGSLTTAILFENLLNTIELQSKFEEDVDQ